MQAIRNQISQQPVMIYGRTTVIDPYCRRVRLSGYRAKAAKKIGFQLFMNDTPLPRFEAKQASRALILLRLKDPIIQARPRQAPGPPMPMVPARAADRALAWLM